MLLTKERALELHREKWLWIAKEIVRWKKPLDIDDLEKMFVERYVKECIENNIEYVKPKHNCSACEYAEQKMEEELKKGHGYFMCKFCPLNWGTSGDEEGRYMCELNDVVEFYNPIYEGTGLRSVCRRCRAEYVRYLLGSSIKEWKIKRKQLYKKQAKIAYKIAMLPESEKE